MTKNSCPKCQKSKNVLEILVSKPFLASYVSPTCRNVEEYKDIPIDPRDKLEFLSDLYSGKVVSFQIPDANWLVSNKWINSRERDSAIFVKNLEVFLPTSSAHERNVRVEWKAVGMNYFTPQIRPVRGMLLSHERSLFLSTTKDGVHPSTA